MTTLELWVRAAAALGIIALVLGGLKYVLRGLQRGAWPRGQAGLLAVVESRPLTSGATLYVVRIGARYFALAGGQASLQSICEVPPEAIEAR